MHNYENNRSCKIKRASPRVGVKDQIWANIAEHDMQDHQATFTIAHNVALTWHVNKSLRNFVFTFRAAHRYPQFNSLFIEIISASKLMYDNSEIPKCLDASLIVHFDDWYLPLQHS
jgi:hypothetical protein